jgi:hypothetical protein
LGARGELGSIPVTKTTPPPSVAPRNITVDVFLIGE